MLRLTSRSGPFTPRKEAPEPVRTFWRSKKSCSFLDTNSWSFSSWPIYHTNYADLDPETLLPWGNIKIIPQSWLHCVLRIYALNNEDSILVVCNARWGGKYLPTFRRAHCLHFHCLKCRGRNKIPQKSLNFANRRAVLIWKALFFYYIYWHAPLHYT
jgi:hypothetical protein